MPDPKNKKKTATKNPTTPKKVVVSKESIPMANRTINNMLRLEPESDFATQIESARTNARSNNFVTGISPKDTVNVVGVTTGGEQYKMFAKKGSPNDIMQQDQGLLPSMFRPIVYDTPEQDPGYVKNYNYQPRKKNNRVKGKKTK